MSRRSYGQPTCGLATALDLLGERWTLLIVRELMPGPKRYSDLSRSLAGVGTNLLADRLKHLEEHNILSRRVLPPPSASSVYELTDLGRGLEPVLLQLAQWGAQFRDEPCEKTFRPEQIMFELFASFDEVAAATVEEVYRYQIDDYEIWVMVSAGTVRSASGVGRPADATITTDPATFLDVLAGRRDVASAISAGKLDVSGASRAIGHSFSLFRR